MSGLEIFLLVLVIVAVLVIAYQVRRNQELARSLWLQIAKPRTIQPLPPAAETISLAAFHRATDRSAEENKRLDDKLQAAKAEAQAILARAETEARRLADLYLTSERERESLARQLQRLRQEQGYIATVN